MQSFNEPISCVRVCAWEFVAQLHYISLCISWSLVFSFAVCYNFNSLDDNGHSRNSVQICQFNHSESNSHIKWFRYANTNRQHLRFFHLFIFSFLHLSVCNALFMYHVSLRGTHNSTYIPYLYIYLLVFSFDHFWIHAKQKTKIEKWIK